MTKFLNIETLQLKTLSVTVEMVRLELESLWYFVQGKVDIDDVNFSALYSNFGQTLYLYDLLRLRPLSDKSKKKLQEIMDAHMSNKATHQILYQKKKGQLVEQLTKTVESEVVFFEQFASNEVSLNVPNTDEEDHPLLAILDRRDRNGWMLIGIRLLQTDEMYTSVDVEQYDRRMKIVDLTLKRKVLECVTYHFKDFRETMPFAPNEFWWRHIAGHEYMED